MYEAGDDDDDGEEAGPRVFDINQRVSEIAQVAAAYTPHDGRRHHCQRRFDEREKGQAKESVKGRSFFKTLFRLWHALGFC